MTYQIFSKLNKGDTITFSQFEEIFKECGTATIKADNARGCKTVSVSDVKTGDKVNNGTCFIEVVAEVVAEVEEDKAMQTIQNASDPLNELSILLDELKNTCDMMEG